MASDPTRDLLVASLRRIRRQPGQLSKERLAPDELLVEYLGEGDLDQAWATLATLLDQHQGDPTGDVSAFFATCGWATGGNTLDARLKRYAAEHHVDERTALRRSDRGALKIAQMLRHGLQYERPQATILMFQNGSTVRSWVQVHFEANSGYRLPRVYLSGKDLNLPFELEESMLGSRYATSLERLPDLTLDPSAEEFEHLASIHVVWAMPIWPAWDLNCHIVDERLYARLQVDRASIADVGISWINEYAIGSRDATFKYAEVFPPDPGARMPDSRPGY